METAEKLENFQLQLDEIALLESMYPGKDEVLCEDLLKLSEMKKFISSEGSTEVSICNLNIKVNLKLDKNLITIVSSIPSNYPKESQPDIYIRSNNLNRTQEDRINNKLQEFLKNETDIGDLCISQVVQWVSDNVEEFLKLTEESTLQVQPKQELKKECNIFSRFWIFSHHIYSKQKRKMILDWSKELKLTGFSMPGKPGVVCCEGLQVNCEEYWKRLRNLNWKRISLVEREDVMIKQSDCTDNLRLFKDEEFSEKNFAVHGGRDYHMDLGLFFEFLERHGCQKLFPILFGVEGKSRNK